MRGAVKLCPEGRYLDIVPILVCKAGDMPCRIESLGRFASYAEHRRRLQIGSALDTIPASDRLG